MRTGRCLCRAVTYEIEGDPVIVAHCYCIDCQRLSGAGHTTGAMFPADKIRVRGEVSEFRLESETKSAVTRTFCPKCGSPLFGRNTRMAGFMTVSVGTLDDPNSVSPQAAVFARSRRHWDSVCALPTFDAQPAWEPESPRTQHDQMLASRTAQLNTFGFVVLRGFVDPAPLSSEFDVSLRDAFTDATHRNVGAAGNQLRYVPTMCERTPVSLALITRLSTVAAELLGASVLPVRAKATNYLGSTKWHRDTDLPVRSLGFAFYLEPLDAETGALRVVPGSHRPEFAAAIEAYAAQETDLPGVAVPTVPGDVIAFDEHLYHGSVGGGLRRQWRVDFVADLPGTNDALRQYFARQYSAGWDGGYDVERFPSYGEHWRTLDPRWNNRLDELGAYRAAADEEAHGREQRSARAHR